MRQCCRLLRPFIVLLLFCEFSPAQRGALLRPASLQDLTARAQTIVRAHVVSARVEPHPQLNNLQTVVLTLSVSEAYKGKPGSIMTIRQFIWDIRDKIDGLGYRKGQEYILFLNPTTRYGLTSTTGLDQGRFLISTDSSGNEVVSNNAGNAGLLSGGGGVEWAGSSPRASKATVIPSATVSAAVPGGASLPNGEVPVNHFVRAIKGYVQTN